MAWRAITEADLLNQISGDELSAFRAASLGTAQADPVTGAISQVTAEVRGYVAANAGNHLGTAGTVPEEVIVHAVALVVLRVPARVAGMLMDGESVRRDAAKVARKFFEDVARGLIAIVQPTVASTEVVGAPMPSIKTRGNSFQRVDQDGV